MLTPEEKIRFVLISSWLGQYDLLSVVQTEKVPLTQQWGGMFLTY